MKIAVILLNLFLCRIGTFVAGQITSGIIQVILLVLAMILAYTVIGLVLAVPLALIVWLLGMIFAFQYKPKDDGIQRFG